MADPCCDGLANPRAIPLAIHDEAMDTGYGLNPPTSAECSTTDP